MVTNTIRFGAKWREVASPQTISNVQDTTLSDDIQLSDSVVSLVLEVNQDTYTKLLSSAINGANIYYPDEYLAVIYPLLRAGQMSFCDEVLNCILNNADVREAIAGIAGGAGGIGASGGEAGAGAFYPIPANVDDYNLLTGATCTDDNLYAIAVGIVEFSFDIVGQFFDILELATQPFELQAELADNAPAVATALPASVLDWGLWVQDTAGALWDVYDSPTTRDEVACELFCVLKFSGCNLTFDDLLAFFAQGSAIPIAGNTLQDILVQFVLLNSAELVGKTSLAFMYGVLALGSRFAGLRNVGSVMARVFGFVDDTNNNWTAICDPCSIPVGICGQLPFYWLFTNPETAPSCVTILKGGLNNQDPARTRLARAGTETTEDCYFDFTMPTNPNSVSVTWTQNGDVSLFTANNMTWRVYVYRADDSLITSNELTVLTPNSTDAQNTVTVNAGEPIYKIRVQSAIVGTNGLSKVLFTWGYTIS